MKPFIIAEIGVNHNGSIELAKKLIFEAFLAGANAVKFQTFKTKYVVSKSAALAKYQQINSIKKNQHDLIKNLELSQSDFIELKNYSDAINIEFISTPFDEESLKFLVEELNVKKIKLSSCDLNNVSLLWHAASYKIPLIISSGMSSLDEIEIALSIIIHARLNIKFPKNLEECLLNLKNYNENKKYLTDVIILHCTTAYPCPIEYVNLNAMRIIKDKFNLQIGYSDHSNGKEVCAAATALGAVVIEKHITLSKKLQGPDHQASMEPKDFKEMINSIRKTYSALGIFEKKINAAEQENCKIAKRSVYAKKDISKGKFIEFDDLIALRPENEKAIPASRLFDAIGKIAKANLKEGQYLPLELIDKDNCL